MYAEDRADQERCEDVAQQVQQQRHDHRDADDPSVVLQSQLLALLRMTANDSARQRRMFGRQAP